jgi:hypothetical protein
VRLALKVVMQNDGDFVNVILLCLNIYYSIALHKTSRCSFFSNAESNLLLAELAKSIKIK